MIAENEGRFVAFHPGNDEQSREEPNEEQLDQVRCIIAQNKLVTFGQLRMGLTNDEEHENYLKELSEKVHNFVHYAGPVAAEIVLVLWLYGNQETANIECDFLHCKISHFL